MCGIAGFSGFSGMQFYERLELVDRLGEEIDRRGRHAAGWVGHNGQRITMRRTLGTWEASKEDFGLQAASHETLLMHARYATCGNKADKGHAHPFAILRQGLPVLYGVHNGVIYSGAEESAKANSRDYSVDSREVLELLADGQYDAIRKLSGYGTLGWMVPGSEVVRLVRMTYSADLVIADVSAPGSGKGIIWASTLDTIRAVARDMGYTVGDTRIPLVGKVVGIWHGRDSYLSDKVQPAVTLDSGHSRRSNFVSYGRIADMSDETDMWANWPQYRTKDESKKVTEAKTETKPQASEWKLTAHVQGERIYYSSQVDGRKYRWVRNPAGVSPSWSRVYDYVEPVEEEPPTVRDDWKDCPHGNLLYSGTDCEDCLSDAWIDSLVNEGQATG